MSQSQTLRPAEGYRILLELSDETPNGARYAVTVFLPTNDHPYAAHIALPSGEVELTPGFSGAAPEGPHAMALAQLRTIARAKVKHLDQPWPRRILRWRPDKPTP